MITEFSNNTTVPSISAPVPFDTNMPPGTTARQEKNASSNEPHGLQIKGNTEEDLWTENETFATTLIPAMIFVGILMIVGCVGNTLVVYIFGYKFKSATQHSLIVCLACFDLLMSLIAMPSEIADMRFHHMFSSVFACKLLRFITMFSAVSSSLILVVIAVDRHRRVTKPLKRQMTVRHARILEVVSVCAALLLSWPSAVLTGLRSTETTVPGLIGRDCSFSNQFKDTKLPFAHNSVLGIGFVVVITVLAVLYFQIWKTAKHHMLHIFGRPKKTLSPTFSDAFKHNGDNMANSNPDALKETPASGGLYPHNKKEIADLNDPLSSPSSSEGVDINCDFSEINIHNCEILVTKECDEQLWEEISLEVNGITSRNSELVCKIGHFNNCFDFGFQSLVETTDRVHFTSRLRAKSLDELPSDKQSTQCFTACKSRSAVSSPEIRFSEPLNDDYLFKATCLERRLRFARTESDRHIQFLTSEKIKPALEFSWNFEQPTMETEALHIKNYTAAIGTSSQNRNKGLLMYPYLHEANLSRKQIAIAENDFELESKMAYFAAEADMTNSEISRCGQKRHTEKINNTFISVPRSAQYKTGRRGGFNLMVSDMNSDSTNSTSLEELDLYSYNKTVERTNSSGEHGLGGSCEVTQLQCHILDGCCSNSCNDKTGQTDAAPLDAPCAGDTTQQLFHNQVPSLTVLDVVDASPISHLIGQRCEPVVSLSQTMSVERVTSREASRKVDCELNNRTSQKKIKKTKTTYLTRVLPRLFNTNPTNEDNERSPECSVYIVTNKQGSIFKQHSNVEQQRRISANSPTSPFKAIGRRPSRHNDKTTLVAFSISSVFVLSFLPYLVLMFVRSFMTNFDYNLQGASLCAYNIFLRFYLLNSAANPLLYGLLNERFRQECKTILFYFYPASTGRASS